MENQQGRMSKKESVRCERAQEEAKTQIFPKEGKAQFSQEAAEKQGIP